MAVRDLVGRVVSHPTVNRIQTTIFGQKKLDARLEPAAQSTWEGIPHGTVVDIGGGSARSRSMWPASWRYISIDPDPRVSELHDEAPIERLVGSAADVPLPDNSADVVLMQCVSHHLDDRTWPQSLDEIDRILKPGGDFVFLDGVWSSRRWISRLFWRLDVGRHPRTSLDLEGAINDRFKTDDTQRFTLIHHVILVSAKSVR